MYTVCVVCCAGCQNLILKMLCYDPKKRLSIEESQKHPWITMKGFYPLPPAPVCRAVTYDDVNQFVLSYMSELETMKGQNTDVLVQNILDRKMTTATSTYHLLVKAFEQCQARHKKAPTSGITCKRSSSDNSLAKKAGGSKTAHTSEFNRRISESQLPPLPMSEGLSSARKVSLRMLQCVCVYQMLLNSCITRCQPKPAILQQVRLSLILRM